MTQGKSSRLSSVLVAILLFVGGWLMIPPSARASDPEELYSTPLFGYANLISYYRFEGNSTDSKGSNDGTYSSVAYSSGNGEFGEGAGFAGSSGSYITTPNTNIPRAYPFTVTAWINRSTGGGASESIFGLWNDYGSGTGWDCRIEPNGDLGFVDYSGGTGAVVDETVATISDGSWTHVAFVASTGTITFYVNGSAIASASITDENPSVTQTADIGNLNANFAALYYSGAIDDLAVFSQAWVHTGISNYRCRRHRWAYRIHQHQRVILHLHPSRQLQRYKM